MQTFYLQGILDEKFSQICSKLERQLSKSFSDLEGIVDEHHARFIETAAALEKQASELERKLEDGKTLAVQLGEVLIARKVKIPEMVKQWAKNGEDPITKMEFRLHVRKLLDKADTKSIDALFAELDDDGGGKLDVFELKGAMKALAEASDKYIKSAAGTRARIGNLRTQALEATKTAETTAVSERAIREIESIQQNKGIDARLGTLLEQKASAMKVSDIVQKWDTSGDGLIDKDEFRTNVKKLGLVATNLEIDDLFDKLDKDGGGELDSSEIKKAFRHLLDTAKDADKRVKHIEKSLSSDLAATRSAQAAFLEAQRADEEAAKERARNEEAMAAERAAAKEAEIAARAAANAEREAEEARRKAEYDARLANKRRGSVFGLPPPPPPTSGSASSTRCA